MTTRPEGNALWGGRFTREPSDELKRLSRSPARYFSLAPYDLAASKSHASELQRAGLLTATDLVTVHAEIDRLTDEVLSRKEEPLDADEDVHTFLERVLLQRLGPLGGVIRAGRSRNDQAANDLRLYLRDRARTVARLLLDLIEALSVQAEKHLETPAPGFTHLQPAQPIVFGHQLLAHAWPLLRDLRRLEDWDTRAATSPLGAAALAGSTF